MYACIYNRTVDIIRVNDKFIFVVHLCVVETPTVLLIRDDLMEDPSSSDAR